MDDRSVLAGDGIAYAGDKFSDLNARAERGLRLYEEHGHEIERIADGIYRVPSQHLRRTYTVEYGEHESCSCPDHEYRGVVCVHIFAVGVMLAKRRTRTIPCAGCGCEHAPPDLVEIQDWHESLTYFDGELVCRECADAAGVPY